MRAFPIVVACSALVAGFSWISIASKFRVMYEQMGISPPHFTSSLVNSPDWIPGGMAIIFAGILIALVVSKQSKIAEIVAVSIALSMVFAALVLPRLLAAPLSGIIRDSEAGHRSQQAEQDAGDQAPAAVE